VSTAGTVLVQATSDPLTGDGRLLADWPLAEASANHSAGHADVGHADADHSAGHADADHSAASHAVTAEAPPAGWDLAAVYGGSAWRTTAR
jgi:hypothetical protein